MHATRELHSDAAGGSTCAARGRGLADCATPTRRRAQPAQPNPAQPLPHAQPSTSGPAPASTHQSRLLKRRCSRSRISDEMTSRDWLPPLPLLPAPLLPAPAGLPPAGCAAALPPACFGCSRAAVPLQMEAGGSGSKAGLGAAGTATATCPLMPLGPPLPPGCCCKYVPCRRAAISCCWLPKGAVAAAAHCPLALARGSTGWWPPAPPLPLLLAPACASPCQKVQKSPFCGSWRKEKKKGSSSGPHRARGSRQTVRQPDAGQLLRLQRHAAMPPQHPDQQKPAPPGTAGLPCSRPPATRGRCRFAGAAQPASAAAARCHARGCTCHPARSSRCPCRTCGGDRADRAMAICGERTKVDAALESKHNVRLGLRVQGLPGCTPGRQRRHSTRTRCGLRGQRQPTAPAAAHCAHAVRGNGTAHQPLESSAGRTSRA